MVVPLVKSPLLTRAVTPGFKAIAATSPAHVAHVTCLPLADAGAALSAGPVRRAAVLCSGDAGGAATLRAAGSITPLSELTQVTGEACQCQFTFSLDRKARKTET